MRQTLKDRRKQLSHYRGTPASRLLTMVLMLAIMGLIFVRLRDPNTWRWFARDNDEQIVLASETAGTAGLGAVHPAVQTSSAEKAPPSASPQASPAGKQKEPSPAAEKKTIDAAEPAAVASGKAARRRLPPACGCPQSPSGRRSGIDCHRPDRPRSDRARGHQRRHLRHHRRHAGNVQR